MNTISVIIPIYNAADHIVETLHSVSSQVLPDGWQLEIIAVDDGSNDRSPKIAAKFPDKRLRLIVLQENGGRARARNTGLKVATGEFCLFIDADCSYTNQFVIQDYINIFESGIKASFGAVTAKGEGFWQRYQIDNHQNRLRSGDALKLITTSNFGAKKDLLEGIGGFDERYQKYGFEDRDLFLTIRENLHQSDIQIAPHIKVYHRDTINLEQVCNKMYESGYYSAIIFRRKHPDDYRIMNYAKIDLNQMDRMIVAILCYLLNGRNILKTIGEKIIKSRAVPYKIKHNTVKGLSAIFYMAGTGKCR